MENETLSETPTEKPQFTVIKELPINNDPVESVADQLADSIPDVTESAIDVHTRETEQINEAAAGLTDRHGNAFDPSIHQTNPDGTPKLSKNDKLMLKRGRKAGAKPNPVKSSVNIPGAQGMQDTGQSGMSEHQIQQAAVTGKVSAHLLINMSMMIGGQDFAPVKDPKTGIDEKEALESAFTDYYIATGKVDMPPGVALTATIAMYVLPRFMLPTVQTRVKAGGGKIYTWWHERKLRKQRKKAAKENGTQFDSGHDGKRENDPSEIASAGLQA